MSLKLILALVVFAICAPHAFACNQSILPVTPVSTGLRRDRMVITGMR